MGIADSSAVTIPRHAGSSLNRKLIVVKFPHPYPVGRRVSGLRIAAHGIAPSGDVTRGLQPAKLDPALLIHLNGN